MCIRDSYVDGNTGEQVAVKNVLVLYTDVSQLSGDSAGRLKVRTTGSGGGLLVRDGLAWPITWEREGESDRLSFYREDGQPAALGVGHKMCIRDSHNTYDTFYCISCYYCGSV